MSTSKMPNLPFKLLKYAVEVTANFDIAFEWLMKKTTCISRASVFINHYPLALFHLFIYFSGLGIALSSTSQQFGLLTAPSRLEE